MTDDTGTPAEPAATAPGELPIEPPAEQPTPTDVLSADEPASESIARPAAPEQTVYAPPPPPPPPPPLAPPAPPYAQGGEAASGRPAPASDSSKLLAALSYIFGVIALVMLFVEPYKDEKFVRFHAVQGVALWVVAFAVGIVGQIPVCGWVFAGIAGVAVLVVAIIGAVKAFQGEYYEVPIVYGFVKGYVGE